MHSSAVIPFSGKGCSNDDAGRLCHFVTAYALVPGTDAESATNDALVLTPSADRCSAAVL